MNTVHNTTEAEAFPLLASERTNERRWTRNHLITKPAEKKLLLRELSKFVDKSTARARRAADWVWRFGRNIAWIVGNFELNILTTCWTQTDNSGKITIKFTDVIPMQIRPLQIERQSFKYL